MKYKDKYPNMIPVFEEDVTPEKAKEIITNFMATYEKPDLEEGFDKVLFIKVKSVDLKKSNE